MYKRWPQTRPRICTLVRVVWYSVPFVKFCFLLFSDHRLHIPNGTAFVHDTAGLTDCQASMFCHCPQPFCRFSLLGISPWWHVVFSANHPDLFGETIRNFFISLTKLRAFFKRSVHKLIISNIGSRTTRQCPSSVSFLCFYGRKFRAHK